MELGRGISFQKGLKLRASSLRSGLGSLEGGARRGAVEVGPLEEEDQEHLERDWIEHRHKASEPTMERAGWGQEPQS